MVILLDSTEMENISIITDLDCSVGPGGWRKVSGTQLARPVLLEWFLSIWVTTILGGEGNRFTWKSAGLQ